MWARARAFERAARLVRCIIYAGGMEPEPSMHRTGAPFLAREDVVLCEGNHHSSGLLPSGLDASSMRIPCSPDETTPALGLTFCESGGVSESSVAGGRGDGVDSGASAIADASTSSLASTGPSACRGSAVTTDS